MTIVTFLGLIESSEPADYRLNPKLAHMLKLDPASVYPHINMFDFLLSRFPSARIVAVGTPKAFEIQKRLIARRGFDEHRIEYIVLDEVHDYPAIFRTLSDVLRNEKELIVDISHSFRHLPSLMMVDMIIENLRYPGKIRHILFAKEIEAGKRYTIVDLREYLTLANVSYALSSFTKNYTVSTTVRTVDELYQALLNELTTFSEHILANSFDALLYPSSQKPSVTKRILEILEQIKNHPTTREMVHPIVPAIDAIAEHMKDILRQAEKARDERYYYFAKNMFDKGYLLNALTLVNEAAASYCVEGFRNIEETKPYIQAFEKAIEQEENPNIYNYYELSNIIKNIIKLGRRYSKQYRTKTDTAIADAMIERVRDYINRNYWQTKELRDYLYECDNTRNNLAHANSAQRVNEARKEIAKLMMDYEEVCQREDPLQRFA